MVVPRRCREGRNEMSKWKENEKIRKENSRLFFDTNEVSNVESVKLIKPTKRKKAKAQGVRNVSVDLSLKTTQINRKSSFSPPVYSFH